MLGGHLTPLTDKDQRNISQASQMVSIFLILNSFSLCLQAG